MAKAFETRFKRGDGSEIDVQVYEAPLVDASGSHRGWMGSVIDITEARRAARTARAQEENLARTGRLVTLGEMASTLAHELNHIWSWGARMATLGVVLGRVPGLLRLLAPPRREFDADKGGASLTGNPPGLASALGKLSGGGQPPGGGAIRHLWIVAPEDATHPTVENRIAALGDL